MFDVNTNLYYSTNLRYYTLNQAQKGPQKLITSYKFGENVTNFSLPFPVYSIHSGISLFQAFLP